MRDVLDELDRWWAAGETVGARHRRRHLEVLAAPARRGDVVGPDGTAVGSVSGGCVEGAVYELAEAARDDGAPVLQRYGVSDDDAFAVGLTCGGIIDIFVEQVDPRQLPRARRHRRRHRARPAGRRRHGDQRRRASASAAGWSSGRTRPSGSLGSDRLDDAVRDDARGLLAAGQHRRSALRTATASAAATTSRCSSPRYAPKPRMIVFGAIDFAAAVARVGSFLGYRVTVCDARETFATASASPTPTRSSSSGRTATSPSTEVDERTVLCVLTHDPKFDVPLLEVALRMPVAYVGAMGSRRTNDDRVKRLRELGVTEDELARLHAPIGLDIGARTPEETAVSIAAEIIAARWGGSGAQLRQLDGPIHRNSGSPAA